MDFFLSSGTGDGGKGGVEIPPKDVSFEVQNWKGWRQTTRELRRNFKMAAILESSKRRQGGII